MADQSKDGSVVVTQPGETLSGEVDQDSRQIATDWREVAFTQAGLANRRKGIIRRLVKRNVRVREQVREQLSFIDKLLGK